MHRNLTFLLLLCILFFPASAEFVSYWPGFYNSISTSDVTDITNGPDGSVFFATSNGLSVFDKGEWMIFHSKATDNRGYVDGIPLYDYIKCVEYDSDGNLWLGYNNGIQIYNKYTNPLNILNGYSPQGNLESYSINDLQSLGDQMWIATGSSGLYCYQNGEWKWFKPYSETGPNATRIASMAIDYSTGSLIIASAYQASSGQGQYILQNNGINNPQFSKISDSLISEDMENVRTNNMGGVYFFNKTDIVSYSQKEGASHILNIKEISDSTDSISDISSSYDGKLIVGTNYGLYAYKDTIITDSIAGKDLINNQIDKVFTDSEGRWWFTNKYFAGYYFKKDFKPVISVEIE